MSNPNHYGRLARVAVTTVGALIGAVFGVFYFTPMAYLRPPTSADVVWDLSGVSVSVVLGAALFSWAGKT